jgi:vacuolar fusion protein MON1
LNYVCVSTSGESFDIIYQQLQLLHNQILFSLTKPTLEAMFDKYPNLDIRQRLGGTDLLLDRLSKSFKYPDLFLDAFKSMKLPPKQRRGIQKSWISAKPPKAILFGLVLAKDSIIYSYNPRKQMQHPKDMLLLINMINSSTTFKAVESWVPACLPEFNNTGCLYCYVHFFTTDMAILLLSIDKDAFYELSQFKSNFISVAFV